MNRNVSDPACKDAGSDEALLGASGRRDGHGRIGPRARSPINSMSRFVVDVYLSSDGPVRVHPPGPPGEDGVALASSSGFIQAVSAGPLGLGSKIEALNGRISRDSSSRPLGGREERSASLESEDQMTREVALDHGGRLGRDRRPKRSSWWRFIITFAVAVLLVSVTTAANLHRRVQRVNIDWQLVKLPPVEVKVEPPTEGRIIRRITAPGKVEPVEEAEIGSQMSGRVAAVNVKEGDRVKVGDVLVKLDDVDARAHLISSKARSDRLRAAITQAEIDLAKASRDQTQHGKLAGRGFSSANELADARTVFAKAESALEISRHELLESEALWQTSQEELKRTEIRSPIDGVVTTVDVSVGEVVIAGTVNLPGSVLMTVSDLTHMRVSAEVDESDVALILPGQPSRIFLQSREQAPIQATVEKVGSKGRRKTDAVSFITHVRVDDPHPGLRAGMTATVEIEVRRVDDALGVPVQAVVHRKRRDLPDSHEIQDWVARNVYGPGERARDADARYVRVVFVAENGVARARPVETGLSDERRVEVRRGLRLGDRVITGPFRALDELKDGQPVRVIDVGQEGDRR